MPAKKERIQRVCERPGCGVAFLVWPSRADQRYCSVTCRNAVNGRNGSTHTDRLSQVIPDLVSAYQAGVSAPELAKRYGVNTHAICYRLRQAGIVLRGGGNRKPWDETMRQKRTTYHQNHRPHNYRALHTDEVVELYVSGLSALHVGRLLNCSEAVILQRLHAAGVELRSPGIGQMHYAQDGHRVRSALEVAVDNWLFEHDLPHEIEPRCPWDLSRRTPQRADFRVGDTYIEVWGITDNARYDQRRAEKLARYRACGAALIELFPEHIHTGDYSPLEALLSAS